ncbi:hypothetical protein [Nesterenkonia lutea]|uniref:Leucine rich repeat variant domain-containing protein n=1 Tax=Nesterenkonia lutea TaxID=272919 RepID=A0ABR9JBX3_9MICC|nr:hypothetical protein [Nesterenkonia lutea]MBE1523424.1 hypothetical protein [Nesterenkonia lutea]
MSTNTPDPDDLAALASDPRTDWEMLHWIAEHHAQLRPAVAANPGAYPELVDALGQLGDPAINAAIAQRPDVASPADDVAAPADSDPLHQMWDPRTADIPAHQDETENLPAQPAAEEGESLEQPTVPRHVARAHQHQEPEILGVPAAAAAASETAPESEPDSETGPESDSAPESDPEPASGTAAEPESVPVRDQESYDYPVNPAPAEPPAPAPDPVHAAPVDPEPAAVAADPGYPASYPAAYPAAYPVHPGGQAEEPVVEPRTQSAPRPEGSRAKVLTGVALAVVVLLGIGALMFTTLGDEDEPLAEPAPVTSEEATPEEEEPTPEETAAEEPTAEETSQENEEALEDARAAVTSLAADTSCQSPSGDASVVSDYLTLGAESDALTEEDAQLVEETFGELQSECSSVYAASVFQGARSGAEVEAATETMETAGTDWVNRSIPIGGAENMSSFVTPDGNIACEFDGGLRCTAYEHDYVAPAGCDEGTTYLMQVDAAAQLDCGNPVQEEDYETLGVDQAASDGFMACVSLDDRVSCYNALSGNGFEISERGHYPTN